MRKRQKANVCVACGIAAFAFACASATMTVYEKAMAFEEGVDSARIAAASYVEEEPVMVAEPVVVEAEPEVQLYDVPLDEEVQLFIIEECERRDLDPAVVLAMIYTESRFEADVVGDNGQAFGLLQIWPRWHYQRMLDLGCTDLMDPKQNVAVGMDILIELLERYENDMAKALTSYNRGSYEGEVSTYAKSVLAKAEEIEVLDGAN